VAAGALQVGDRIRTANGGYGVVEAVVVVSQPQLMYNLSVDEAHTFFVGAGRGWCIMRVLDMVVEQLKILLHASKTWTLASHYRLLPEKDGKLMLLNKNYKSLVLQLSLILRQLIRHIFYLNRVQSFR
jgi:hypothetical protein